MAADSGGPKELEAWILEKIDRAVHQAALQLQAEAVQNLTGSYTADGYRTGKLAGSIVVERRGPAQYAVGTNMPYAMFVETGTGIYGGDNAPMPIDVSFPRQPIRAKNGKFLHFFSTKVTMTGNKGQALNNAKKVTSEVFTMEIKGMKGKWFMSKAYMRAPEILRAKLQEQFR